MRLFWGTVRTLACALCVVAGGHASPANAQSTSDAPPPAATGTATGTPRTGPCPVKPADDWTPSEAWAWEQICQGLPADMAVRDTVSSNPGDVKDWPRERVLRPQFLRHILSDPAYVEAITFQGVRIRHALFEEQIDLSYLRFDKPLDMFEVVFLQPLVMRDYQTASTVILTRSWLAYAPPHAMIPADPRQLPQVVSLDLVGAQIGRDLVLDNAATGDVDLQDIVVGQHVVLDNATIDGVIELSGAKIGAMLFVRHVQINYAFGLVSATVGKDAIFVDTQISNIDRDGKERLGSLRIDDTHIAGSLFIGKSLAQVKMPEDTQPRDDAAPARDAAPIDPPAGSAAPDASAPDVSKPNVSTPDTTAPAAAQPGSPTAQGTRPPANRLPPPYTFRSGDLTLNNTVVERQLSIRTAEIRYFLEMQNARVGADLWLTSSKVGSSKDYKNYLSELKVGGFLLLQDSAFEPQLFLDGAEIGRHLIMSDKTEIKGELKMRGTKILANFYGEGAQVTGPIDMQSIVIGRDLYLTRGTRFDGDLNASFAHIGGSVDLTGGHFASVDLTGTRIAAELRLANDIERSNISKDSTITLRNVEADSLLDVTGVWPDKLELDGFTYRRFGGAVPPDAEDVGAGTTKRRVGVRSHSADELLAWLDRQQTFSTQPYSHLAGMLRQSGDRETADAITFQAKKLQWQHAPLLSGTKLLLGIEYIFTGFGVHPLRLLYWVAGLVALGFIIFSRDESPDILKMGFWQRLLYSFDMLLPVVHLRHHHSEVQLKWVWARAYLYIHKIMGYVLIALLLAAITAGNQID